MKHRLVLIIACLFIFIGAVRAQAQAAPPFLQNLRLGSEGQDVIALQKFLNTHGAPLGVTGSGSTGNEVPYFGLRTQVALIKYQTAHADALGIVRGTGFFGPVTRAFVNKQLETANTSLPPAPLDAPQTYRVTGQSIGTAAKVTLQLNGKELLTTDGLEHSNFIFAEHLKDNEAYEVTITKTPDAIECHMSENAKGIIHGAPVNIVLTCAATTVPVHSHALPSVPVRSLRGDINGITGPLTISAGEGHTITLVPSAASTFEFPTPFAVGSPYQVSIVQAPADRTCYIDRPSGIINDNDFEEVRIACVGLGERNPFLPVSNHSRRIVEYTIGGIITGLTGTLDILNNGVDLLTTAMNGMFTFNTTLTNGQAYNVTVASQPAGQTCVVTDGSGTVDKANVTSVSVSCAETNYCIGDPCQNGGVCTSGADSFSCECSPCFYGPTCTFFDTLNCS